MLLSTVDTSDSARANLERLLSEHAASLRALTELAGDLARVPADEAPSSAPRSLEPAHDSDGGYEVCLLGSPRLRLGGRDLPMPTGKPGAILRLLAHHGGRPVSRDAIIEAVWPDVPLAAASNRLRVAVHALRRAAAPGADLVGSEDGSYFLNSAVAHVDADRFEALVQRGGSLERRGAAEDALVTYEQAVALYAGDYLRDEPGADWAFVRRLHLHDVYLNLRMRLAALSLARGDLGRCITHSREVIAKDACNEDAYRLLMEAYARAGHRARALQWFDACHRALARELGVPPSAATLALRDRVRSGAIASLADAQHAGRRSGRDRRLRDLGHTPERRTGLERRELDDRRGGTDRRTPRPAFTSPL